MNIDDESLLSAYLDDELDDPDRARVEAAVGSSARLAVRLRQLAEVRSVVGDLPAPGLTSDLAGPVLAQIRAGHAGRLARFGPVVRHALLLAPGLATAAAVLIASLIGGPGPRPPRPAAGDRGRVAEAPRPTPRRWEPVGPPDLGRSTPAPRPAPASAPAWTRVEVPTAIARAEAAAEADRDRLRRLVGRPDVRRITVTLDTLGTDEVRRVDDALRVALRTLPWHAQVRVRQGLVIDPAHPDEAVVYALELDETEHQAVVNRLDDDFPGRVREEGPVAPALAAQLPEVGRVEVVEGGPQVALLAPAPAEIQSFREPERPAVVGERAVGPGPSPRFSGPARHPDPASGRPRPRDRAQRPPVVYLVWVTRGTGRS